MAHQQDEDRERFLLSRLARQDLDEIREYTLRTWGQEQWLKYYGGLVDAFRLIAADPRAGRDRSHFAKGMRSVNYGRHVIFFAPVASAGERTVVLRIVHQRRNLPALAYYETLADQIS